MKGRSSYPTLPFICRGAHSRKCAFFVSYPDHPVTVAPRKPVRVHGWVISFVTGVTLSVDQIAVYFPFACQPLRAVRAYDVDHAPDRMHDAMGFPCNTRASANHSNG